jgi:hypothetical protein
MSRIYRIVALIVIASLVFFVFTHWSSSSSSSSSQSTYASTANDVVTNPTMISRGAEDQEVSSPFPTADPYATKKPEQFCKMQYQFYPNATSQGKNFAEHIRQLPLDGLIHAYENDDQPCIRLGTQQLMSHLVSYSTRPPKVSFNKSCVPKELPRQPNCSAYPDVFSGPRKSPVKIGHAVMLAFEIDVLEVALHQYEGLVDRLFIIESVSTHYKAMRKPLLWEKIRDTPRFARFSDWVVHLVMDDADIAEAYYSSAPEMWTLENFQENQRWKEIKMWNDNHRFFGKDDLIGFGDVDEIPSRENIHLLKHCELKPKVRKVDIGIWFTEGRVKDAYLSTEFAVPGFQYSLGDPTFYRYEDAVIDASFGGRLPTRQRGRSGKFLVGGMHMTYDCFLPTRMLKALACTECGLPVEDFKHWNELLQSGRVNELEEELMQPLPNWIPARVPVETIDQRQVSIPWLLECNPKRYPTWWEEHDTRLE